MNSMNSINQRQAPAGSNVVSFYASNHALYLFVPRFCGLRLTIYCRSLSYLSSQGYLGLLGYLSYLGYLSCLSS